MPYKDPAVAKARKHEYYMRNRERTMDRIRRYKEEHPEVKKRADRFWRSVNLTGNQTETWFSAHFDMFWRSVNLTGNQTATAAVRAINSFWRSVNLTGNQTGLRGGYSGEAFWRSVNLTGNQT